MCLSNNFNAVLSLYERMVRVEADLLITPSPAFGTLPKGGNIFDRLVNALYKIIFGAKNLHPDSFILITNLQIVGWAYLPNNLKNSHFII